MATPRQQEVVEANKKYTSTYKNGVLPMPPSKKTVIITCMDGRVDPSAAFGLGLGDAHVVRNAGASGKEAARSVLLSNHVLGTEEVMVVKHTHCGMLIATRDVVKGAMTQNLGDKSAAEVASFDPMPITDLEASAKEDVEFLRNHPLAVPSVRVTGWVLDIETGLLKKVVD